jgi:hypothetical protein
VGGRGVVEAVVGGALGAAGADADGLARTGPVSAEPERFATASVTPTPGPPGTPTPRLLAAKRETLLAWSVIQ